ncbi:hypothetical protein H4582DRAFT_2156616 [Lactarius indigo]|nr:hypothetical protein H4582DRAFT_2156616 [Lactarius indigo]
MKDSERVPTWKRGRVGRTKLSEEAAEKQSRARVKSRKTGYLVQDGKRGSLVVMERVEIGKLEGWGNDTKKGGDGKRSISFDVSNAFTYPPAVTIFATRRSALGTLKVFSTGLARAAQRRGLPFCLGARQSLVWGSAQPFAILGAVLFSGGSFRPRKIRPSGVTAVNYLLDKYSFWEGDKEVLSPGLHPLGASANPPLAPNTTKTLGTLSDTMTQDRYQNTGGGSNVYQYRRSQSPETASRQYSLQCEYLNVHIEHSLDYALPGCASLTFTSAAFGSDRVRPSKVQDLLVTLKTGPSARGFHIRGLPTHSPRTITISLLPESFRSKSASAATTSRTLNLSTSSTSICAAPPARVKKGLAAKKAAPMDFVEAERRVAAEAESWVERICKLDREREEAEA